MFHESWPFPLIGHRWAMWHGQWSLWKRIYFIFSRGDQWHFRSAKIYHNWNQYFALQWRGSLTGFHTDLSVCLHCTAKLVEKFNFPAAVSRSVAVVWDQLANGHRRTRFPNGRSVCSTDPHFATWLRVFHCCVWMNGLSKITCSGEYCATLAFLSSCTRNRQIMWVAGNGF